MQYPPVVDNVSFNSTAIYSYDSSKPSGYDFLRLMFYSITVF